LAFIEEVRLSFDFSLDFALGRVRLSPFPKIPNSKRSGFICLGT
jgi:hypothetical protein